LHAGRLYQILAYNDKTPIKGTWSESRDLFYKFSSKFIFVIGEARHLET